MLYNFFIQSIAIFALIVFALSFHAKSRNKIIIINTLSLVLWTTHFYLLHAWTGVVLNLINIVISLFFLFKDKKKWIDNNYFLAISLLLLALATYATWQGFFSIFAFFGISIMIVAKWQNNAKGLRYIASFASISWILYDYFIGSTGGMISEAIIISSVLISMIRNPSA